jgi:hypothetical protein
MNRFKRIDNTAKNSRSPVRESLSPVSDPRIRKHVHTRSLTPTKPLNDIADIVNFVGNTLAQPKNATVRAQPIFSSQGSYSQNWKRNRDSISQKLKDLYEKEKKIAEREHRLNEAMNMLKSRYNYEDEPSYIEADTYYSYEKEDLIRVSDELKIAAQELQKRTLDLVDGGKNLESKEFEAKKLQDIVNRLERDLKDKESDLHRRERQYDAMLKSYDAYISRSQNETNETICRTIVLECIWRAQEITLKKRETEHNNKKASADKYFDRVKNSIETIEQLKQHLEIEAHSVQEIEQEIQTKDRILEDTQSFLSDESRVSISTKAESSMKKRDEALKKKEQAYQQKLISLNSLMRELTEREETLNKSEQNLPRRSKSSILFKNPAEEEHKKAIMALRHKERELKKKEEEIKERKKALEEKAEKISAMKDKIEARKTNLEKLSNITENRKIEVQERYMSLVNKKTKNQNLLNEFSEKLALREEGIKKQKAEIDEMMKRLKTREKVLKQKEEEVSKNEFALLDTSRDVLNFSPIREDGSAFSQAEYFDSEKNIAESFWKGSFSIDGESPHGMQRKLSDMLAKYM